MSTGCPGFLPIAPEDLGVYYRALPSHISKLFETSVFPRMAQQRPWIRNSEDFLRKMRARIGNTWSMYPESTFQKAYPNYSAEGVYYTSTDRIAIKAGKIEALPHELRHRLDNGIELTDEEVNILKEAFGDEFLNLERFKDFDMIDEMVTTNFDARNILLGEVHLQSNSVELQNKIIDKKSDEQIVKALESSNGYGWELIKYLR